MQDKKIVVYFSCGVASAVATQKTIEKYGDNNQLLVVNFPIKEEHPDNARFLADVENWLGISIIKYTNPNYPSGSIVDVFDHKQYMSGVAGAVCTSQLKKKARQFFEKENSIDYMVLGFTYDEIKRHQRFVTYERDNLLPVLIEAKLTKQDCFDIVQRQGIEIPYIYKLGYPNANCIGCVKATSPTYWNLVRDTFPDVFKRRAKQSRQIGCRLVRVKGKRKFLDELKPTDKGQKLKNFDFECSIFCEEKLED